VRVRVRVRARVFVDGSVEGGRQAFIILNDADGISSFPFRLFLKGI